MLAALLSGLYGPSLSAPFIFDDTYTIGRNRSIDRLWPLLGDSEHPGPLRPPQFFPTAGRPLVNFTFALNYQLGESNPWGYHAFNLTLHWMSALLLWAILARTLRLDYFAGRFEKSSGLLAFLAAMLWAVHPLNTDAVIYVTQRTELLMAFCYLATLYSSLRYWAAKSLSGRVIWLAIATLAALAGMASKEVMVSAPLMVLLFEWMFVAGSLRSVARRSWPLYTGLFGSWLLLLLLNVGGPRTDSAGFQLDVAATSWWFTQAKVLAMYLKLVVWPWPLAIHYGIPYLTTISEAWPWLLPVVFAASVAIVATWKRQAVGYIGVWVFVILSPTLVVPIVTEVAAERRMYLPLSALAALAVVGGYIALNWILRIAIRGANLESLQKWTTLGITLLTAVLAIVFSMVTVRRTAAFGDEMTLWKDTVATQPNDPTALYNMGTLLVRRGNVQEAVDDYRRALAIKPDYAEARYNLGNALLKLGKAMEALKEYQRAVEIKPDLVDAQSNLGTLLLSLHRPEEAVAHLQEAVRVDPNDAEVWGNLVVAYSQSNRTSDAVAAGERALKLARLSGQNDLADRVEAWLADHQRKYGGGDAAAQ
jgi:Tfp pilus assembly protein PilF